MKRRPVSATSSLSFAFIFGAVTALLFPIFSMAQSPSRCEQLFIGGQDSATLTATELRTVRLKALTNTAVAKRLAERETEAVNFYREFGTPSPGYDVEIFKEKGGVFFGQPYRNRVLLVAFKDRLRHPEDFIEQMYDSIDGVSTHQRYAIEILVGERFKHPEMYVNLQSGLGGEQKIIDYAAKSLMDDLETLRHEFQSPDMIDGFQVGHVTAEGWNHSRPQGDVPLFVFAKMTVVFNSPVKPSAETLETLVNFAESHLEPKKP